MFIERQIFEKIEKKLATPDVLLLSGARQVGKTTLLKRVKTTLEEKHETTRFLSLEDPLLRSRLDQHPENLFEYVQKTETQKRRLFILLDEIQLLQDPSNFLKYHYDLHHDFLKLVVTGSSAFYIDQKFKDSLAGRKSVVEVFPFSFSEFLLAKGEESLQKSLQAPSFLHTQKKRLFLTPERQQLFRWWQEYVLYGGYPKVVLAENLDDKKEYLQDLSQSFLKKDFQEAGFRNDTNAYRLLQLLASQVGQLINQHELANTLKCSHHTIGSYLYILEKAYILSTCHPFHQNIRKELTKMPKSYFLDTGFRNAILHAFTPWPQRVDQGGLLENAFFQSLKQQQVSQIQFWRTQDQKEIDFIVDQAFAFEIKMNPKSFKPSRLRKFQEAYPKIQMEVVTSNDDSHLDLFDFVT